LRFAALYESVVHPPPEQIRGDAYQHAHEEPQKGKTRLRDGEAVIVLEDKREGPEEY
jgi:hypothetical protein